MPYLNRLLRLRRKTFFKSRLRFFNANFTQYENAGSSAKPSLSAYSAQRHVHLFHSGKGFPSSGTVPHIISSNHPLVRPLPPSPRLWSTMLLKVQRYRRRRAPSAAPLQWSSSDELHEFHPGTQPHTALCRGCSRDGICQLAPHRPFAYGR